MTKKQCRVLLVEDDEVDYKFVERGLKTSKSTVEYQVQWIQNPELAVEAISQKSNDIVLLDFSLGSKTGLEILQEIAHLEIDTPVVMLTEHVDENTDTQAIQEGAVDYLVKSEITPSLLERSIRHACERKSLLDDLKIKATYDDLTEIYNRRYLIERLGQCLTAAKRYHENLSVSLCDLDNFKSINDRYGHHMGDQVLKNFASIIKQEIRNEDFAGRLGGDEFCIVLPRVSPQQALICIERIRSELATQSFSDPDSGEQFQETATFGIAAHNPQLMTAEDLIKAADKAMYQAREQGKNRVQISS